MVSIAGLALPGVLVDLTHVLLPHASSGNVATAADLEGSRVDVEGIFRVGASAAAQTRAKAWLNQGKPFLDFVSDEAKAGEAGGDTSVCHISREQCHLAANLIKVKQLVVILS